MSKVTEIYEKIKCFVTYEQGRGYALSLAKIPAVIRISCNFFSISVEIGISGDRTGPPWTLLSLARGKRGHPGQQQFKTTCRHSSLVRASPFLETSSVFSRRRLCTASSAAGKSDDRSATAKRVRGRQSRREAPPGCDLC